MNKEEKYNKQELIEKLLPLIREVDKYHCFGSTYIGSIDFSTREKTTCQCSGDNEIQHYENQKRKCELYRKMINIVEEITKYKDVFIAPGTYSDCYFCVTENNEDYIIIGLNYNGEIKESRRYA